jgi:hypothetical protein
MMDSRFRGNDEFNAMHRIKFSLVLFLSLLLASPAPAPTSYSVESSTASVKPHRRRHRPLKEIVPRKIRQIPNRIRATIKKTSPNPKVLTPEPSPMPLQSPTMPAAPAPSQPPRTGTERFFNAVTKVMTKSWNDRLFVWLPAVSTDPNTGPTGGIMPVMLLSDKITHHIRHLFAPSYTYNSLFGQTGTWRYYYYPTDESQLFTTASISQHTNREIKARYENPSARDGVFYIRAESYYTIKGSNRFFGVGSPSRESDESGYVSKDTVVRTALGFNFSNAWRTTVGARYRKFATAENIIPNIKNLYTQFPQAMGVGTEHTVTTDYRLLWDTRDAPVTPSRGASGEIFFENTWNVLGSDANFLRYGLEGKRFLEWPRPGHVTVVHGLYEWANGPKIPFYELSSVGGRETLRGYGEGRLVDRGRFVLNLEHRITYASLDLMGIQTKFETAPFFDLGSVFPTLPQAELKYFRPVYGCAFRAAVKPNVVGDVEVGVGKEGAAVYVDINYPF